MILFVSKDRGELVEREPLYAGTVGTKIEIDFSEFWKDLDKMLIFTDGCKEFKTDIGKQSDGIYELPWELLSVPGRQVNIGVYGYISDGPESDKTIIVPTKWFTLGYVKESCTVSTIAPKPTPNPWDNVGKNDELHTTCKTTLVCAINETFDMASKNSKEIAGVSDILANAIETVGAANE